MRLRILLLHPRTTISSSHNVNLHFCVGQQAMHIKVCVVERPLFVYCCWLGCVCGGGGGDISFEFKISLRRHKHTNCDRLLLESLV